MTKKLRIGCWLCTIVMLFTCALSGCTAMDTDDDDSDDRNSYHGNNINDDNEDRYGNVNGNKTNSNQNNSNSNHSSVTQNKLIPSTTQIERALQAENYFWMRDYDYEDYLEDMPSGGAVKYYRYEAARFYDEYGNVYPFNSNSLESLIDNVDYETLEGIEILYVQFDSASSAHNAFNEMLNDGVFEGSYYTGSGSNWERAWQNSSAQACNTLLSRIDGVLLIMYADWDDFQDAGIAYDNAAIKAMEDVGF